MSSSGRRFGLSNTATNTLVSTLGVLLAVGGWLTRQKAFETISLGVLGVIVIGLAVRLEFVSRSLAHLKRARPEDMAHPEFFSVVHNELEDYFLQHLRELADGYIRFTAAEIPGAYLLLYRALTSSNVHPKCVLATDLTKNPGILLTRHEYLAANRRLIDAHGSICRVFICQLDDLADKVFASDLLELVRRHKKIGVSCGLAIREHLRPQQAVDFIVFGNGAVIVEEEQADSAYTSGRSTIYFKRVDTWSSTFNDLWDDNETSAAPSILGRYEVLIEQALDHPRWSRAAVKRELAGILED